MDAEDTANSNASGPAAPTPQPSGSHPAPQVRREGVPPSGSVPQRTAFRTTTGVQPVTPGRPAQSQPASGQHQTGQHQTGNQAPAHQAPSQQHGQPAGAPPSVRPTIPRSEPLAPAPSSFRPVAPAPGTPTPGNPAPGAPASATPGTEDHGAHGMSAALGLGKVKDLAGRAKEAAKEQVIKADASRAVTPVGAPRKVRVLISRIDPWSVLKLGFLLSIAAGIMLVVAVHVLWQVLNAMGTFELAREWVSKLFTENSELNILPFFEYKKIMSATVLIAVVDVLLLTGLSTLGAFLYNSVSRVVGGIYMTLTDD